MGMNEETKRIVCRMIAGLLTSDEDFTESERRFVDKLLGEFGIPASEWDAIFPLLDQDEAEQAIRSLQPEQQQEAFNLLVSATLADGIIAEEERDYLSMVGKVIGISDAELLVRLEQEAEQVGS
jgi:uncharacterized tellurite resistance protein B-like protein